MTFGSIALAAATSFAVGQAGNGSVEHWLFSVAGSLDVEVLVRYSPDGQSSHLVPVRIGLAEDHASVLTGLTEDASAVLSDLHQLLVKKVRTALEREVDGTAVSALASQIAERARQPEPVDHPDILAPREQLEGAGGETQRNERAA